MAIKDILIDIAPEFATADSDLLDRFISYAALSVNRDAFLMRADLATAYLAAHILKLSKRKGVGGTVITNKAGDLMRQYSSNPKDTELDQTSYGKEFKRLRRAVVITPLVV